jgi:quercetin dioxygenase-like cupin family protein
MKTSIYYFFGIAVFAFLLAACGSPNNKESQKTDKDETTAEEVDPVVVFENDYAEVVKVTLPPAASLAAHEGAARVIYSLSDYAIDWVEKGKKEGTKSWKKGDVHVHEAGQHAATNNGTSTAEWLAFAKKDTELPDCGEQMVADDVNSVASDFATLRFDNEVFRLTEVTVPAGAKIPMHAGVNRIIYSLSDYQIMYESGDEGTKEKSFKRGDVHWHEACQHALENVGTTEAKFLVVAYKKKGK